ncbi:lasso RiPP family leader peptide-containing protein [Nocardioides sp.]|uniref:lasso RiPP family leader peptide-containing protein n=1 Tax=Nocardioides sp. TaxID=35761 RepID=UPI0039C8F8A8
MSPGTQRRCNQVHEQYESPKLTAVGSVRGLTMGQGFRGSDDHLVFTIPGWGTFDLPYGQSS